MFNQVFKNHEMSFKVVSIHHQDMNNTEHNIAILKCLEDNTFVVVQDLYINEDTNNITWDFSYEDDIDNLTDATIYFTRAILG